MKKIILAIVAFFTISFAFAQVPDASLLFPITTPTTGTSVNTGAYNQVTYNHNGAASSSSSYTNCAGFTSGNVMRIGSNTTYFEVNTPNGYINKIEIRLQSNSTTAAVAVVAFSTNGTTWTNFAELAMPANNANPSCQFHTVIAPATAKFFRIARAFNTTNFPASAYTPVGATGQTVRIFEMYTYVNAITPTLITSTNSLTGFSQVSVPSASQSYTVSGSSLTSSSVAVNSPAGFQISTDGITWLSTLNLPVAAGIVVGQPKTIYVRLNDNIAGPHSGNITHTSAGATTVNVALSGNTVITPMLNATPSALNFGNVYQGSFSAEQSYVLSGLFLSPAAGNITLTAPAGYQITTTSGTGYSSTLTIPYTGSNLNNTTIYVRFFPTTNGAFNGNITNSGGGATAANVALTGIGTLLSPSGTLTNLGIDFWTGFGYHQRMASSSGAGAALSLYISAQQATTVKVSIPGIADPTFPKIVSIPANSAVEVTGFPTGSGNIYNSGNTPDSRLYFTGITPRGIHIESLDGVPVAVYEHTYGTDCAGATLLLPTNTWGATYNVLSLGGTSNTGVPNSFFFVMAKEDGTQIQITPTADIIDSSAATLFSDNTPAANILYPAGVPFTITLNKGQVFNAMSRIVGSGSNNALGQDLTGTLIKTIDCQNKKIAVWGGNGRTFMNTSGCTITSGSDNLIQQMLPKVAWGTKYLTTPTKTMEYGIYRIYVSSPTTQVKLNGTILPAASLINNFYYQIETNQPSKIEGDKPINVSQFVVTANCKGATDGNNGTSDPEMILLSPVQQSIKNASVFSASKLNIIASGGSSYINVVLKNGGTAISSFKIDGLNVCDTGATSFSPGVAYQNAGTIFISDAFKPHPQDANYLYAKFKVPSGVSHNIICDSGFNAIAYGLVNGESYGYNAGTAIKDLSAIVQTHNPYDTVPGSKTCKGNPNTLEIALPYFDAQIDSIKWDAGTNTAIAPNGVYWDFNPTPIRTFVQDDITYNVYQMPTALVFSTPGIYRLYATVFGTFSSECGSTQIVPIDMEVVQDTARFNFIPVACGNTQVSFTDLSAAHSGGSITQWLWNFGDATTSNVQNPPPHIYPALSVYNATLRVINEIGCFTDTTRVIDLTGGLTAKFGISPTDTICAGNTITFNDLSTSTGINGSITLWKWNFSEGPIVNATTNANQTHTYNTAGTYTVTLQVQTSNGCLSILMDTNIVVKPLPVSSFTNNAEACLNSTVSFTNTSTISNGTITGWSWNFGDPASGVNNTSTLQNPTHVFSGIGSYTITLNTQSAGGCNAVPFTNTITINALPTASFTVSTPTCAGLPVTFTSTSVPNSGTLTEWQWDFGDASPIVTNTNGNPFTHTYATSGSYTATLKVKTDKGCFSTLFSLPIIIKATPVANFNLPANLCLPNATHTFNNTTTISDGTIATVTYLWDFGDATPTSTATNPTHTFTGVGPYTVTLTATSANGCGNVKAQSVTTIFAAPIASFTAPVDACNNTIVTFTSTSTASGSAVNTYSWNFGDPASGVNNTSTLQNPTHTFSGPGTFNVSLQVTNTQGCSSGVPVSQSIIIYPTPALPTVTTPVAYCQNATGTALTATGTNLLWYIVPTGGTGSNISPTPITTTAGTVTYYVSQTANGCEGPRAAIVVNVTGTPAAPAVTTPISICQNTTTTPLTATGTNLLWYTAATGGIGSSTAPTPITTTVGTTNYYVSQSVNTCEGPRANIVVNIIPSTTAPIVITPITYCQNATAVALTATGTSLLWYTTATGGVGSTTPPIPNTTVAGSFNFYASQTGVCGEGPRALINVIINPTPALPTVTTPVAYCQNATATALTATGTNLLWYTVPTGGTGSNTAPTPITTTAGTVTYYVSQTANGCEGPRAAIVVNVTGTPAAPTVITPISICQNTTTTPLTATGTNLLWYTAATGGIGSSTAPTPITTTVGTTNYYVSQSVNTCEGPRANIVVNIIPSTTAPIVITPITYCQNATAVALTATGTSLLWYTTATGGVGSTTPPIPNTTVAGSFNFYVSQTGVCGEGPRALINVIINAAPSAAFTIPTVRCANSVINFTDASVANSGTLSTWTWNFGDAASGSNNTSTIQNPTHTFTVAGTYTVTLTVTNSFGCSSAIMASQNVVVNPIPFANFTASTVCIPTGLAQFTNASTISSGSINTWLWNFGDATPTSSAQNPSHIYTSGGIKNVMLTVTSAAGCVKDTTINISVYNAPSSSFNILNTGSLCSNLPIIIKNTSTVAGFGSINTVQVFWDYLNDITNVTTDNSPVANANYTHSYPAFGAPLTKTYRVLIRCTSGNGCTNDSYTDVVILAAPVAQLANFAPICEEINSITLTQGSNANTLSGVGVYSGNGITSSPTFVPQVAGVGNHIIRYTFNAANGCSSFIEKNIIVNPTPIVELGPTRIVIEGDPLTISPTSISGNGLTYLWTPNTYFTSTTNTANAVVMPTADINYKLTVTSSDGCTNSDNVFVKVIKDFIVPNTFTPNNDGVHDTWDIQFLQFYPNHTVQIFTRTGQKVFESNNYTKPWGGTVNGKSLPIDTYYYIIDLGGARPTKKGFVTIIK